MVRADREVRVDRVRGWGVVRADLREPGVRCIRRVLRRPDLVVRGSVLEWALGRDSARGLGLDNVREWVEQDWRRRLRVKRRVRHVRVRAGAGVRITRRAKKAR